MSGIIRNLITIIVVLINRNRVDAKAKVTCFFLITPFDCGISVLKSDKYFQLAESAQLDFLVKTKLFGKLRAEGISFVNVSQLVKFMKPISVFKYVRVETKIIITDEKCAYFSHSFFLGGHQHSEVLVKMKFKKGSLTVNPDEILGEFELENQSHIQSWNQTLEAMS